MSREYINTLKYTPDIPHAYYLIVKQCIKFMQDFDDLHKFELWTKLVNYVFFFEVLYFVLDMNFSF